MVVTGLDTRKPNVPSTGPTQGVWLLLHGFGEGEQDSSLREDHGAGGRRGALEKPIAGGFRSPGVTSGSLSLGHCILILFSCRCD